jgi:hypothetical protein
MIFWGKYLEYRKGCLGELSTELCTDLRKKMSSNLATHLIDKTLCPLQSLDQ